ncbi:MAG: penicillin-binding protein 2 [Endomicrobiales bacterium]|nr:penicillin-binding protein 2 [Endomicrobiales bacterium]
MWQQESKSVYDNFVLRNKTLILFFVFVFFLLATRLFQLQIISAKYYALVSEKQCLHIVLERPQRGKIYDVNGDILANNEISFAAYFYPFFQRNAPSQETINKLQKISRKKNLEEIIQRGYKIGKSVKIAGNLSFEEMLRYSEQKVALPGLSVVKESRRKYLSATQNAHLIGYVNEISKEELDTTAEEYADYQPGDLVGRTGIEQSFDSYLRGNNGGWQVEVNAQGKQTRVLNRIDPVAGSDVYITIDNKLQEVATQAIAQTVSGRGALVALDTKTGAVKAFVSAPSFNPEYVGTPKFSIYLTDDTSPLFNRALKGLYPPGSAFKIISLLGALENGNISVEGTFFCNGSLKVGDKIFHCEGKHGEISAIGAMTHSCNVYFYNLALKTGSAVLEKYARYFGFGEKTGIDLYDEKSGLVPGREWKFNKFKERWQTGDTLNMAIGQGQVLCTPLQLAQMISCAANKGYIYRPYIVQSIKNKQSNEVLYSATIDKRLSVKASEKNWQILNKALESVIRNGTGKGCYLGSIRVAGKTGTSQTSHGTAHAIFVCFAPVDDPQIAIAVIVENGGSGGTAAVPVARKVLEEYFKIVEVKKEKDDKKQ